MGVQIRETGTFPCFDYYEKRIKDKEDAKKLFRNLISVYRLRGVPDEDIMNRMVFSIVGRFLSDAEKEELLKEDTSVEQYDCRANAVNTYGSEMAVDCNNLCLTCVVYDPCVAGKEERDFSVIAKMLHFPWDELMAMMEDADDPIFTSRVVLDRSDLLSGTLGIPCVVPLAQIVYDSVMEEGNGLYSDEKNLKGLAGKVISKIEGIIGKKIFTIRAEGILRDYLQKMLFKKPMMEDSDFDEFMKPLLREDTSRDDEFDDDFKRMCEAGDDMEAAGVSAEQVILDNEPDMMSGAGEDENGSSYGGNDTGSEKEESEQGESQDHSADESTRDKIVPAEEDGLKGYRYFRATVPVSTGGVFTSSDSIEQLALSKVRYQIPFAENSEDNVIVHHEIHEAILDKMIDISVDGKVAENEIAALETKVRKDFCVAMEIVYVIEQERYILLIWNAGNRRYDYVPLIDKTKGELYGIPYAVRQFMKSEKRKVICYQPYLLCGVAGLYFRYLELKNVHSIYSINRVLMNDGSSCYMEDILGSFFYGSPDEILKRRKLYQEWYGEENFLLSAMPFYQYMMRQQFTYAQAVGKDGLCASQFHKDLMYGCSYLSSCIYPSRQGAAFKLGADNHFTFLHKVDPCISYFPGYIMEYTFMNVDEEEDRAVEDNIKNNRRAKGLLLKELAKSKAAWYHGDLKILYMDDYRIVFFVSRRWRAVYKTDVSRILMHETYRYKIASNRLYVKFWATGLNVIRYINKH